MIATFVVGIFTVANSFIAMFIVIYAFLFLRKTKSHKDRRPWDYLLLASVVYLIYTITVMLLQIYEVKLLGKFDLYQLSLFFQFVYTGMILLSFISQTDLIFKNDVIIIMRKIDTSEKKNLAGPEIDIGPVPMMKRSEEMEEKLLEKISDVKEELDEIKETEIEVEHKIERKNKKAEPEVPRK